MGTIAYICIDAANRNSKHSMKIHVGHTEKRDQVPEREHRDEQSSLDRCPNETLDDSVRGFDAST